jgi:peroxiredoxin (alkyl hydroperoxide reductase subunit C)
MKSYGTAVSLTPLILRMIDALQFTEEHGEVCPAEGDKGMVPSADGVASYLTDEADKL